MAYPILLTQLTQAGYGLIDAIMVAKVSPEDLAAISVGAGLWLPTLLTIMGVIMATSPLVAREFGAQNIDNIPRIIQQSLWLAILLEYAVCYYCVCFLVI